MHNTEIATKIIKSLEEFTQQYEDDCFTLCRDSEETQKMIDIVSDILSKNTDDRLKRIHEIINEFVRGRYGLQAIHENYYDDTNVPECIKEERDYYLMQVRTDLSRAWEIKNLIEK